MKRLFFILVAGALTFGTVYGFAASLNLNTDSLGAGRTVVAACQAGALTATYTSTYSAAAPGYQVGTVTVNGLTSACYSKAYKITLANGSDVSLGEATGTTPASGTSFAATFSPTVGAATVAAISVVISG
jgi:hypothetical protein